VIKVLDPASNGEQTNEFTTTRRATERKATELTVLANIAHPNTVHYFGFLLDRSGSIVLVMERLDASLDKLIDKLNRQQKLKVLLDIG
jgi:serine/threonine protein kinase